MPLTYDDLSALSPVVRKEVLTGELQRRVKAMDSVQAVDVDTVVETLIGFSLNDVVDGIHNPHKFSEQVQSALGKGTEEEAPPPPKLKTPSPAASADSRLLDPNALNATASAPEHPSTPVSLSASLSTPPRTSSPSGSLNPAAAGGSERDRILAAVGRLEPARAADITELLMSLSKRERAMCLFNVEVLRTKVADAKAVLESDDAEEAQAAQTRASPPPPEPVTPVKKVSSAALADSPQTPDLSSRGPSAATSPIMPTTPSATTYTIASLARMPATEIIALTKSSSATGLPLPKADPLIIKATDEFIDSLADLPSSKQKQQLGDKL